MSGKTSALIFLLAGITALAYGNTLGNGFVWDDNDIIVNNKIHRDPSNIGSLFQSADSTTTGNQTAYYRPLNRLTYVLDYRLFGLNPTGYHVENMLLHLAGVLLLYLLARKLFGKEIPAFLAALLFAVHPVNSEAVNFLSARNTLLSTLLILASFLIYQGDEGKQKNLPRYLLSGLLYFLALLSKETALMFVPFLLAHEIRSFRDLREAIGRRMLSLSPFFLVTIFYLLLRANALPNVVEADLEITGLVQRLQTNIYILPKYMSLILFPLKLNAYHSVPVNYLSGWMGLLLSWVVLLTALYFLIKGRTPVIRTGLLWFAFNFLPISNIVPIPSATIAERYMYLPAIGLWVISADLACRWFSNVTKTIRHATIAVGVIVALALAGVTHQRNRVWHDNVSFFSALAEANPDSKLAHYGLGLAYYTEHGDVLKARSEWEKTAQIDPNYFHVLGLLGESYLRGNALDKAEHYYARAVEANPKSMEAIYNLAVIKEKLAKPEEALYYYEWFLASASPEYARYVPIVQEKIRRIGKSAPSPR
jgi:tetratricopeptide (TPR) repeat protein